MMARSWGKRYRVHVTSADGVGELSRRRQPLLVIAHRGASAVAPESTLAALREAVRAGAGMIELDVQMTRDGRFVIFHDDQLERTTNGTGRVARMTYLQLAALDAGSWFHPRFSGERILLASQVVQLLPSRVRINFELKRTVYGRILSERFLCLVRELRACRRLLISSFVPELLEPFVSTRIARALICRAAPDRSLKEAVRLGCCAWHPRHTLVTRRRVDQAHAAGLRVHAWTVDDSSRATVLVRWGVDGMFTNHPARLLRSLR